MKTKTLQFALIASFVLMTIFLNAQTTFTVGTQTSTNSSSSFPCPLQDFNEGHRGQYIFSASQLTAAGLTLGNISAIKFNVTTLNGFSGVVEQLRIKIGTTPNQSFFSGSYSWQSSTNSTFGPVDYVPTLGLNTFTFSTPFYWDGLSNIYVEVCNGGSNAIVNNYFSENVSISLFSTTNTNSLTYSTDDVDNLCSYNGSGTYSNLCPVTSFVWSAAGCIGTPNSKIVYNDFKICSNNEVNFEDTATNLITQGIARQWQVSLDSVSWTNIINANTKFLSYTQNTYKAFYRDSVTCTNGGLYKISNVIKVLNKNFAAFNYASIPFTETFENWTYPFCTNAPNSFWTQTNSETANWDASTVNYNFPAYHPIYTNYYYQYGPPSTIAYGGKNSAKSARFYGKSLDYGCFCGGWAGDQWLAKTKLYSGTANLDLHINCNTSKNIKKLDVDMYNHIYSGDNKIYIYISKDSGNSFILVDSLLPNAFNTWQAKSIYFNSSSAKTVIRFQGTNELDMAIDNVKITEVNNCTVSPTPFLTSLSTTTTFCNSTLHTLYDTTSAISNTTYQWQSSLDANNWTNIQGIGINNQMYKILMPAGTKIFYRLQATCNATSVTNNSNLVSITNRITYASLPYTENFGSTFIDGCSTASLPNNKWQNDNFGSADKWIKSSAPNNSNVSVAKWISPNQKYYYPKAGYTNLDLFVNCSQSNNRNKLTFKLFKPYSIDSLIVLVSIDSGASFSFLRSYKVNTKVNNAIEFNSSSPKTIIRFKAVADSSIASSSSNYSEISIYDVNVFSYPNCNGKPVAGNIVDNLVDTTFDLVNYTNQKDISIKWLGSLDSINWYIFSNDTLPKFSRISIYNKQFFKAIVTCPNTNQSDTTPVFTVIGNQVKPITSSYLNRFEKTWIAQTNGSNRADSSWWNDAKTFNWIRATDASLAANHPNKYAAFCNQTMWQTAGFSSMNNYVVFNINDSIKNLNFDIKTPLNFSVNNIVSILISKDAGRSFTKIKDVSSKTSGYSNFDTLISSSSPFTIIKFQPVPVTPNDLGFYISNYKLVSVCNAAPIAGKISMSNCDKNGVILTLDSTLILNPSSSLKYQWQQSTDSLNWSDIVSAIDTTYKINNVSTKSYFRCKITCSNLYSSYSAVVVFNYNYTFATLPFFESFENTWLNNCNGQTRFYPSIYWDYGVFMSNNIWRRNDDTAGSGWTKPSLGNYSPASTHGNYSARNHTSSSNNLLDANLSLNINCNTGNPNKVLKYDFINKTNATLNTDSLVIQIRDSLSGNFSTYAIHKSTENGWNSNEIFFTSNSPKVTIRFYIPTHQDDSSDIGLDNVRVEEAVYKYAITNGNWGDGSTWNDGLVPNVNDNVVIANYNVNLSGTLPSPYACRNLFIQTAGNLTANANELNIGASGGGNKELRIDPSATLNINGGNINVNGSFLLRNAGNFIMTSGKLLIDGNDGTANGSVNFGKDIFGIGTRNEMFFKLTGTFSVTGGTIQIIDPHWHGSLALAYWNNTGLKIGFGANGNLVFGDSVSTQNSKDSAIGFRVSTKFSNPGGLTLGNLVVNTQKPNRKVSLFTFIKVLGNVTVKQNSSLDLYTQYSTSTITDSIMGNVNVNSYGYMGIGASIYIGGNMNLQNNSNNYIARIGQLGGDLYLGQSAKLNVGNSTYSYNSNIINGNLNIDKNSVFSNVADATSITVNGTTKIEALGQLVLDNITANSAVNNFYGNFINNGIFKSNCNTQFSKDLINNGFYGNTSNSIVFNGTTGVQTINGTGTFANAYTAAAATANFNRFSVSNNLILKSLGSFVPTSKTTSKGLEFSGAYKLDNTDVPFSLNGNILNIAGGYVTGILKRWFNANTNFTTTGDLPVSKGNSYKNARIEFTVAPTHNGWITAEYISKVPGNNGLPVVDDIALTSVTSDGFWRIKTDSITGGLFTLTLTNSNVAMGNKVNVLSTLRSLRRNDSTSNWQTNGNKGVNTGSIAVPQVVRTGMSAFGDMVIAGGVDNNLAFAEKEEKSLILEDISCYSGGSILINLKSKNLNNIASLQGTILWDTLQFTYKSFKNGNSNISFDSLTNIGLTNKNKGILTYSWYDVLSKNIVNGTTIFSIELMPKNAGITNGIVQFINSPTTLLIDSLNLLNNQIVTLSNVVYDNSSINLNIKPNVTASYNSPVAIGDTIKLIATGSNINTYSWLGPLSFSTNNQNPIINNATSNMSGYYYVTSTFNGCTSNKDSVYVNVLGNQMISGAIKTPIGKPINNVKIKVTKNSYNLIDSMCSTNYELSLLPKKDYTIKFTKNNDVAKANGVSSVDAILTQRHILNTTKLNNAYKLLAADVDGNKYINSTDLLRIKRVILGTDTSFKSLTTGENRLWVFVDSSYQFPDTTNPYIFKDSISFPNLTSNKTNQSFIGVRLGDVNWDWNAAIAKQSTVDSRPLTELLVNSKNENGIFNNQFSIINNQQLSSIQSTIHFDQNKYEFIGIKNNSLDIEYNATKANETGNIAILWVDKNGEAKEFKKGEGLFTLVLNPKQLEIENPKLEITNAITEPFALNKNLEKSKIVLKQNSGQQSTVDCQQLTIYPNPTKGIFTIQNLTNIKTIEIIDILGKTIQFIKVKNDIMKLDLNKNPNGIYTLKLIDEAGNISTKKLIKE